MSKLIKKSCKGGVPDLLMNTLVPFKYRNVSAGPNMDWHPLVGQNAHNAVRFGVDAIQNSNNLIRLNKQIHWEVITHYNGKLFGPEFSPNRDYVNSLSFA